MILETPGSNFLAAEQREMAAVPQTTSSQMQLFHTAFPPGSNHWLPRGLLGSTASQGHSAGRKTTQTVTTALQCLFSKHYWINAKLLHHYTILYYSAVLYYSRLQLLLNMCIWFVFARHTPTISFPQTQLQSTVILSFICCPTPYNQACIPVQIKLAF